LQRGVELYFAQQYCNTLLITAFLSSYSFWMGYLMPTVWAKLSKKF